MIQKKSEQSNEIVKEYKSHIKGGFIPLPVTIVKSKGDTLWDMDGNDYIDFLSFFAVANMGHGHPKIISAACKALQDCQLANTSVMSPSYARLAAKIEEVLGYENIICMCSGADATDSAAKIARKWGYCKKGIPIGEAFVLTASNCYHGNTISTHSLAETKNAQYGPFVPKVGPVSPSGTLVKYGDITSLKEALSADHAHIVAFMVEPIEGASGVIDPPKGYIKEAYDVCKQYNILFIADEVQTGLGRAGYPLRCWAEGVKPDLACLGKALSGGTAPLSAVCGHDEVMSVVGPFEIGSTMAANPPATEAALAALEVLIEENICEQSLKTGKLMRKLIMEKCTPEIVSVSGAGSLGAAILNPDLLSENFNGWRLAKLCASEGLIVAGADDGKRIRICPPPVISEKQLKSGVDILAHCVKTLASVKGPIF